jgi:hypothetical protein
LFAGCVRIIPQYGAALASWQASSEESFCGLMIFVIESTFRGSQNGVVSLHEEKT